MLIDFFRINLPYGIAKNDNGEWMAFNREYRPIGFNESSHKGLPGKDYQNLNVYTKYKPFNKKSLEKLESMGASFHKNGKDEVYKIFLYTDGTNPVNVSSIKLQEQLWNEYFEKIKLLSKLSI